MSKQKKESKSDITSRLLVQEANELVSRAALMSQLGLSFNGNRNIYTALGYPQDATCKDYYLRYKRQDIARSIIDAPVDGCWPSMPQVLETGKKDETKFEKEFLELSKKLSLLKKLSRLDRLCGIGRYSVLFFGFAESSEQELQQPVQNGKQLLYITPLLETNAEISKFVTKKDDERYGLPETYRLTFNSIVNNTTTTRQFEVHHSRCLHVAEILLDSEIYGSPKLEPVLNRLLDLEKIVGGSGEMYWQGAFPGMALKADPKYNMTSTATEINDEITKYVHKLQRYMKLQGIDVQQLSTQVSDPSKHVDVQIQMISATTKIPKRILLGSERGELSSSQDSDSWNKQLETRQNIHCEQTILVPFIDYCIKYGVISNPINGYEIIWPSVRTKNEKEESEISSKRAEALSKYVEGGLEQLMSFQMYLEQVCGYDSETAKLIVNSVDSSIDTNDDLDNSVDIKENNNEELT